jgi:hypothetical protein
MREKGYDVRAAVKSVNQAKSAIMKYEKSGVRFFVIDLDHDLGDFAYDGGDGYELVKWLIETGRNTSDYEIICHSMNPVGVQKMRAIIQRNNWDEI